MSDQTPTSGPAARSVGAATAGVLATLVVLVAVLLAFVVAPLALFAVAAVGYLVLRPRRGAVEGSGRGTGRAGSARPVGAPGVARHGFGAGAS